MAKLVYAQHSKCCDLCHVGSSPTSGTNWIQNHGKDFFFINMKVSNKIKNFVRYFFMAQYIFLYTRWWISLTDSYFKDFCVIDFHIKFDRIKEKMTIFDNILAKKWRKSEENRSKTYVILWIFWKYCKIKSGGVKIC